MNDRSLNPRPSKLRPILTLGLTFIASLFCAIAAQAAPTAPVIAQNPVSVTTIIDSYSSFTASFTGTTPITNQWEISWNGGQTYTNLPGQTNGTLSVTNLALVTNVYLCVASNAAGYAPGAPATNTVVPPPPLQLAGDLVVELRSVDLANGFNSASLGGAYTNTVWTNRAGSAASVGNFARTGSGALGVSNNTVNPGAPLWGPASVNALYVTSTGSAVQSATLAPAEISADGPSSGEAWIYATALSGNNSVVSYGLQGGTGSPEEDREMNWGTASGCFSGDFGSLDCKWASPNPVTGAWEYLAWTWDGTNAIGYLNGVQSVKHTLSQSTTFNGYPIQTVDTVVGVGAALGSNPNKIGVDNFAGGWIASVRLSSGVLTASQVSNNFQSGLLATAPITVFPPSLSPTNSQVSKGSVTTLTAVYSSAYPITLQWQTSTNGGTTWTVIAGATGATYAVNTANFAAGDYEYEVVLRDSAYSLVATSSPVTLAAYTPTPPAVVLDTTPGFLTNYVMTTNTFAALFSGEPPITYQWQVSNSVQGAWAAVSGATSTNLAVSSPVPLTNWYRLQAFNPLASSGVSSDPAELMVLPPPPLPPYQVLQTAGDLIVNLQEADLSANSATWTNATINSNGVGNFNTAASSPLNVTSNGAPYLYHNLNVLYVGGNTQKALQSGLLAPPEIIADNPVSAEAWIFATSVTQANSSAISYGIQGGSSSPEKDREFNYSIANGGGVSGDFGSYDTPWTPLSLVSPGAWHYLAWTFNGTTVSLYLDGVLNNTNNPGSALVTPDTPVILGAGIQNSGPGLTDPFEGYIAAARLESGVLTAAQISNNFAAGPLGVVPVLLSAPSLTPNQNVVYQGTSMTLGLVDSRESVPFTYQWQTDNGSGGVTWSNLTGAVGASYVLNTASLNPGTNQYQIVLSNNTYAVAVTSPPVALTILSATAPPAVQKVFNLGPTNVVLVFADPVTTASAANPANFAFTNGLAVTAASLASDGMTVTLTTAPLTYYSNYWIVINNVLSGAPTPVMIPANTLASFGASPYATQDIGAPPITSTSVVSSNGVTVTTAGGGVGGSADQFNYQYKLLSGNFDVNVCLAGLGLSDVWAEAGLMARASLSQGAPFAAAFATAGMAGCFFQDRAASFAAAASTGTFSVNYPNTWLRLQRVGAVFTGYASYDGQVWSPLGTATIPMTDPIYLGLAVASHNTNQPTQAQFLPLTNTAPNAVVGTPSNPHEPVGPSSRKTGVVFSEIMWKPAPRADTNNCEYLELYNSQTFFQDISGYRITCADVNYTFPSGTIMSAGGYLVVAASPGSIQAVYGITNVMGPYTGSLKHAETLELLDEHGRVLLTVPYSDTYPWPVAAGGTGHSIVLANPSYGEGDPRAWDISDIVGGSPGTMESYRPSPLRSVFIDEILAHSENPAVAQYVKLYNHSAQTVDLSGCILTDDFSTNQFVIPSGTQIGPGGFVSFDESLGFNLNPSGDTIYFIKPDGSRILDAVQFEGQADAVSFGRWPDGANDFYPLQTPAPGTNNSPILIGNIVINELMYDPISGNDDDQYIELYNQGATTVSLANWQFTAGVTFTFPTSASIGPNGYVVVGRNVSELFANYTNLNNLNTYGNYSGKLSHNGERVALAMPQSLYTTNTVYVVEDEVTYGTGGRWGQWSSGGGSSLELIDPHSNHRLAANWADSDETQKSQWVDIENTGVLDNGANYESSILHAQIGLLDVGECLVDNVEADFNGSNCVMNPTFEIGLTNWALLGDHVRSSLENSGYQSSYSLHLRSSDRYYNGDNSCEAALFPNPMAAGNTATLRFKARWLHGWPEVVMRLNGGWLEATAAMPVPTNLGTPGAPNSAYVTNAGPAMYLVTHTPTVPAANQPLVVTARVHDPDGLQSLSVFYRIDPATTYTTVAMNDSGVNGDALAGDGIYSATIPGQASNTMVAFYVTATDKLGASTRFPALRPENNEPVRECVVGFGDAIPGGSFGTYHVWITQTNVTRWANLSDLSNEGNDFTFVNNSRVIYDGQGHFAGSPYHQIFDTPVGALCHYKWEFPEDDQFLGATDFNKIHQPGNFPGDDASLQREQTSYTFMRALGVPWVARRFVAVYVNGNRRGVLMEDSQVPGSDMVKEYFPNDSDGFLYKMQPWFEFAPQPSGESIGFNNNSWCEIMPFTTTGNALKLARYRFNFEMRRTPDSCNDYTNVFSLVNAASSRGAPNYVANLENMADMENWMRVFAANHAAGNWDCFGSSSGQNLYGYIGALGAKYQLMMWDFNIDLGASGSWGPGQNLFTFNGADANLVNVFNTPVFLRMYWRALQELVNGPLTVSHTAPLANAKYNAFINDGLSVENPNTAMLPWMAAAGSSIASQLAAVNATNFTVNPTVLVSNNTAYITGVAPVAVDTVWINGEAVPVTWTTLTNWSAQAALLQGTNQLVVSATDISNQPIVGATANLSVIYQGAAPSPTGRIVINEIMYNPTVPNAQYVELYNNSNTNTFDLSNWLLQGLNYTFPPGSLLGPTNFLVLAENPAAYAAAYGAATPVFDIFTGPLPTNGPATLSLIQPGGGGASNIVVAEVLYDSSPPWPAAAHGLGSSLQLVDSQLDNWRLGNWAVNTAAGRAVSPAAVNTVTAVMPPFPPLWINELQALNLTGITNSAGQRAPWVEIYNPTSNAVSLSGLYLANTLTNLTNWAFPSGASIAPGQFLVVFADSQTSLSTLSELHAAFTLTNGAGFVALSRIFNSQPQILDYINYTNLPANYSYGSYPDGQSFSRQQFFYATPAGPNDGRIPPVAPYFTLNSLYTQNFDSLPDPGVNTVDSEATVTINGINYAPSNPLDFADPISSGGLGLSLTMPGWYGLAAAEMRFGASAGDQSTGGVISFGPITSASTNRALGLLATSTTGPTAFGLSLINLTDSTIDEFSLSYTGELWRQQPSAKTLSFSYYIDPTGTNAFSPSAAIPLQALDVNFPIGAYTAEDGTLPANQIPLALTNQAIVPWPSGAALWLVWQMTNDAGTSQGLAIDNLAFSANSVPLPPLILSQPQGQVDFAGGAATLAVNASGTSALSYQWQLNGSNIVGATSNVLALPTLNALNQGSYDVQVSDATGVSTSAVAVLTVVTHSAVAYTSAGAIYTQHFDSLPDPGATTINASNSSTINGVTYSLADPLDFAFPVQSTGAGGLGLASTMSGWYGSAATAIKLGASAGDQTTGGIISFGSVSGTANNRALGLLSTSTTGPTAFAVRILNQTVNTLTSMNLSYTGELWRQQTSAKTLAFSYYVDPTGTNGFSTANLTAALPALNVSFPTGAQAAGESGPLMTSSLAVVNQVITNCPPGAALWLVWQMASAVSSSQGLAIDNVSFSATGPAPILTIVPTNSSLAITWPAAITGYTLQFTSDLSNPNGWQSIPATIATNSVILPMTNRIEFYRLKQ